MAKQPMNYSILLGGVAAGLLTLGAATLTPAAAAERNGINLGTTSFFDGFGGDRPGCTYIQYAGHDRFNSLTGSSGDKVPVSAQLDVNYIVPQLACTSDFKLFGGALGWNTIVPFAEQNTGSGIVPGPNNGGGLGDILVGPYISWSPVIKDGHPVFANAVELDFITPTGKYNPNLPVNPGNDYLSINPFWRATYLPGPGWEISWRLNYIHNFDHNSAINAASPVPGTSMQHNGDGVWANFTVSKEIFKNFSFGLNGYWLKQLTGDKLTNGTTLDNAQESFYAGPGIHYDFGGHRQINVNLYLPVYDVNALSGGYQLNLQYIHPLN